MSDAAGRRRSDDAEVLAASGDPAANGDATVGRLLRYAGPRPEAPPFLVARVQRAARPVWQEKVRAAARARRRQRAWSLAAAAVLLASAGLAVLRFAPRPAPPIRLATIETLHGPVSVRFGGGEARVAAVGAELVAGAAVETGRGGFTALRLAGGSSVRLDDGTQLELTAAALELGRGAVYLDTGSSPGTRLTVATPFGVARDVGTQFEVRLADGTLRVQVREGEVEVEAGGTTHPAKVGTALTVHGDGTVTSEAVAAHGPAWGWVLEVAPPFELDGKTLGEVLDWVARETGWRPRFRDPALEREMRGTVVRGSLGAVRPDQAPDLVLTSSGLAYRLEDGTLWIERAAAP